ncbi:MAG: hypothetical protein WCA91_04360 [Candidatus Acidiferrales bacterium]
MKVEFPDEVTGVGEWMWGNWGVRWPIRRATFHLRQGFGGQVAIERCDTSRGKPVAVFRFLSEDWSPWIALEPGMHLFAGLCKKPQ